MTEPRTHREANIARKGLEDRVDLLQKWLWGMAGLLGAILATVGAIYMQVGDVKTDVAVVKTNVGNITDRLAKIETVVEAIRTDSSAILGRLESRPQELRRPEQVIAGFWLTESEAVILRQLLNAPNKTNAPSTFSMWERLPDDVLRQIPSDVLSKFPKLKGFRYAIDPSNNAIALAEPSGSVIALI